MCDYSLEHLRSVKAQEGESYYFHTMICHGFVTRETVTQRRPPTVACVLPGQRLHLTDVQMLTLTDHLLGSAPTNVIATVVRQRDDRRRFHHFGPYNDGLLLPDGRSFPLAWIDHCSMTVLPALPARDLGKLLALDANPAPVRELVDAD